MKSFKLSSILSIIISLFILAACQNSADETVVRVGDLPVVSALPFYVALEEGYFEELGIQIEKVKLENPNLIVDGLLANNLDMSTTSGAMGISGIAIQKNPGKLMIYAGSGGGETVPTEALFVPKGSKIRGFEDLKGHRLGILPGIQWRTIANHFLASSGIDVDEVQLVELAPAIQPTALKSGQVDALLAIEHMASIIRIQNLGDEIIKNPSRKFITTHFYPGAGIIRKDFAEENPELVSKIMVAIQKGIDFIEKNPNQARTYLVENTPLTADLATQVNLVQTKMAKDFSAEDKAGIQDFFNLFFEYNIIDTPIDLSDAFYPPAI